MTLGVDGLLRAQRVRVAPAGWAGTLGVNWQQAKCMDEHGRALAQDVYGSPLTFSGQTSDTMMLALLRAVYRWGGSLGFLGI